MPSNKRVVPPQETFDRVVTHLRKQGVKAVTLVGSCKYRMPRATPGTTLKMEGISIQAILDKYRMLGPAIGTTLKCAAGCLIPDQNYAPEMEGNSIQDVLDNYPNTFGDEKHDMTLVSALQHIHDHYCVGAWEFHLNQLAQRLNLTYTELK